MSNSSSFSSRLQQARPGSLYRSLPSCGINRDTRTNFVESLNSASMDMSVQETVHNLDRDASRGLGRSRNFSSDVNQMPEVPPRRGGHRRAHSETAFHLPDDVMFDMDPEFADFDMPTVSDDTAEELISMYMDTEKDIAAGDSSKTAARDETTLLVRGSDDSEVPRRSRSLSIDASLSRIRNKDEIAGTGSVGAGGSRPRHRHSNSMDDSTSCQSNHITSEQLDTKKTMAADKLAELALIDPKRAKRILANRQSAIRSKERKMRYISELERKVQTLQTEATTLSAQLTMLQRDTSGLTNENNELKLKLQAMEQQAQLREALNEALREKVQRLKILTGEVVSKSADTYGIIPSGQQPTLNHPYIPQGQQSDHIRNQFQSFPHSLETISHASIPGQAQLHPNFQYEGQFQSGFPVEPQASSSSVSHPSAASF